MELCGAGQETGVHGSVAEAVIAVPVSPAR
jgi:hypothetical protein